MNRSWLSLGVKRGLKVVGALAVAAALSGCIVAPYGGPPRYGYYHPHPYAYY
jgi:hypothetical protein